jgi:hypothetical protein
LDSKNESIEKFWKKIKVDGDIWVYSQNYFCLCREELFAKNMKMVGWSKMANIVVVFFKEISYMIIFGKAQFPFFFRNLFSQSFFFQNSSLELFSLRTFFVRMILHRFEYLLVGIFLALLGIQYQTDNSIPMFRNWIFSVLRIRY